MPLFLKGTISSWGYVGHNIRVHSQSTLCHCVTHISGSLCCSTRRILIRKGISKPFSIQHYQQKKCCDRDLVAFIQGCRFGPESSRQTLVSPILRSVGTICGGLFPKMYRGQLPAPLSFCHHFSSTLHLQASRVDLGIRDISSTWMIQQQKDKVMKSENATSLSSSYIYIGS